ncbi:CPBP family intramembrane metalloprotease [Flavobacterium sp. KB82]|uniref:CPBP family intramembrane metalloprotease n=2 Tax=Flavobacterium hungaricum TaxID=2082725 RepID=A0ABR9TQ19_9FLAO|nr:CPBP family intramembrane metalloprotease [Flavobacterium hungaricum]
MLSDLNLKKKTLIIGILLSVILPFLAMLVSFFTKSPSIDNVTQFYISRFAIWASLLLLFLYSFKIEKQHFLLWGETNYSFLTFMKALLITFLKLYTAVFVTGFLLLLFSVPKESMALNNALLLFKKSYFLLFFTCVTAGITEELIFRGYLLPRLEIVLKNKISAIVLSSILFGLMHIGYGTLLHIIGPTVIGLVFAFQYEKYRNIKILILCHFLWDLLILTLKT